MGIIASAAMMNESYLTRFSPFAEKLYVVCHELGHGLGLPHRDTNHNNFSLGTCLDYTTAYRKNMRPDETDFLNLEKVYGIVGSTNTNNNNRRLSGMKVVEGTSLNKLKDIQSKAIHDVSSSSQNYKDGRLLFKSDDKEIYEKELPDGSRIVTTLLMAA